MNVWQALSPMTEKSAKSSHSCYKSATAGSIGNYPNFHITENNVAYWLRSILYSLFWVQYGTTE